MQATFWSSYDKRQAQSILPTIAEDVSLHISTVSVITPTGVKVFWASLHFAPKLSHSGKW